MPLDSGYQYLAFQNAQGTYGIYLIVRGIHCGGCIQKIEQALIQEPGVRYARLNFSTGRLSIEWIGSADQVENYVRHIEKMGYQVRPFHQETEKNSTEDEHKFLLMCLGVAGFAMGNIMLLSVGLWTTSAETMGSATRDLLHWISALIAIPAVMFSGRPFFKSAYHALKNGRTNMDVPISVGLTLATSMSLFETIHHGEHAYFDSAIMLMFFLLIGRYLDFRARRHARSAAHDLMNKLSGFAQILEGEQVRPIPVKDIKEGMLVLISAGENIPIDGQVVSGQTHVDTSLVTGETLPRLVAPGEDVYAGTVNQSAPITIKAMKVAEQSLLADIIRLMEKAEQGQARYVRLADRAARLYTPVVHVVALLSFLMWWGVWGTPWQESLMIAVTVLIITCPCALALAVPVVQVLASGQLMKQGILLKSGDALERLSAIDTAFFDKTGTLTYGKPALVGEYDPTILQMAASLAVHSQHPLSRTLAQAYQGNLLSLSQVKEYPGQGISGLYNGHTLKLGSADWCDQKNISSSLMQIFLMKEADVQAVFTFEDILRPDANQTIQNFRRQDIDTYLLSGDRQVIANQIGQQTGINHIQGDMTPVQKHRFLTEQKAKGHHILMVGDGLNDAPILAESDVSMAPGTAIDMAQNSADLIFMGDSLLSVSTAHRIAKKAQRLVKENFALTILYNIIAIPLAFAGWVTPFVAALAMSGSSLVVIANSYRLKEKST
ncbi:MAG: cadmium-translocating P-type ATPase [Alphaproteobacteria bacterium]|nr:cadmium-translocating P-type ATPase [Alphaproteobacteria bacterium]